MNNKYKEGEVVICIKEIIFDFQIKIHFKKNEKYIIENFLRYGIGDNNFFLTVSGVNFFLDKEYKKWKKFSDYFITLAEWRNQQIESIFTDENSLRL